MGLLDDIRNLGGSASGDGRTWTTAQLLSMSASRATVSIDGGPAVALPFNPAAVYTGYTTVAVLLDPLRGGCGQFVLCPVGIQAAPAIPPPPPPPPATVLNLSATILPTFSGTWSAKWGRYSAWQPTRYGGPSTLYQGDKYGSGTLTGVATYGDQILNLGASSVTSMTVGVAIATEDTGTPSLTGTASGSQPAGIPSTTGGTASGTGQVDLMASGLAAAFFAGTVKGLVLNGGTYLGIYGGTNGGMALNITYTRPG